MPLGVTHALRRDAVDVRRLDRPAVTTQRTETHVVEHDVDDVRRPRRSDGRLERCPVRLRVANVDVDDAFERVRHGGPIHRSVNVQTAAQSSPNWPTTSREAAASRAIVLLLLRGLRGNLDFLESRVRGLVSL